jgi:hypothetical protein
MVIGTKLGQYEVLSKLGAARSQTFKEGGR